MLASEDIQNFMETLVAEEFDTAQISSRYDYDYVQDLYCLTMNALPPHYVRHAIDVHINLSSSDRLELSEKIQAAIRQAHGVLANDRRSTLRD